MAGRRRINNVPSRKVTTSAKSITIVATNTNVSNNVEDLGLQDEQFDYEDDDGLIDIENSKNLQNDGYNSDIDDASHTRSPSTSSRLLNVSRNGSIHISKTYNDNEDIESVSSLCSHREMMIPYKRHLDMAQDGRQNEYLPFTPNTCSITLLDSSSSSGYSGNSNQNELDEDEDMRFSEEYDITNEEENRLLKSEEEASSINDEESRLSDNGSHKSHPEEIANDGSAFRNKQVVMAGFNIIIKAPNRDVQESVKTPNRKVEEPKRNVEENVKTPERNVEESTEALQWNVKESVRRKWSLRYTPYPPVTVTLEDVGFIPPCVPTDSKNRERESPEPTVPSLKVTVKSNQERMCEEVQESVQCKNEFGFKMPLPPVKRPPTRPRRSETSVSSSSPTGSVLDVTENRSLNHFDNRFHDRFVSERSRLKEDDVISISASSIDPEQIDTDLNEAVQEEPFSNRSIVERWLNTYTEDALSAVSVKGEMEKEDGNIRISLNAGSGNQIRSVSNVPFAPHTRSFPRFNFKDIHPFFNGMCYFHYFQENCVRPVCNMPHLIKEHLYVQKCQEKIADPAEMQKIYDFSLRFHVLFKELYPTLLKGFAHHQMQNSLISSVEDFLALKEIISPHTAISHIISALIQTGLDFIGAVEKISFNLGFMRYPELAEILLDHITARTSDIADNWEVIKRICRARNYIAPKIFERVVSKILSDTPINKDLCKDIYNVIVINGMTDLSKVNQELLTPLKTVSQFGYNRIATSIEKNLSREREIFESLEQIGDLGADSSSPGSSQSSTVSIGRDSGSSRPYPYVPQVVNNSPIIQRNSLPDMTQPPPIIINTSIPPPPLAPPPLIPPLISSVPSIPSIPAAVQRDGLITPKVEPNLCPDMPICGKFKYKKEFTFEISLHNLLPTSRDQVPMNECDIIKLNEAIVNKNGLEFLTLLDKYKNPTTLQHFITMSIAHLKNCNNSNNRPYNALVDLLENLETVKADFRNDPLLKGVFEVIVFNMLFFFERNCQWGDARNAIETFCDWDSLVSSKLFASKQLSPMGRYLFLAKLLIKSRSYYKAYEILHCPDLHLLESPDRWPVFGLPHIDIQSRNTLLTDFFKYSYRGNIEVACDMYRNIFQINDIWEFDSYSFFNPMLEFLINNEKISLLKHFHTDVDIFHGKMEKNVFRAFIILLEGQLSLENRFKLYELGSRKGIYVCFTGKESSIVVRTNMPDNEIKLILQYYMHKLCLTPVVNHDLKIEIRLSDSLVTSPDILRKCLRSIYEVNRSVYKILFECFGINLNNYTTDGNSTVVEVPREVLAKLSR